jgi:multidrug efflux pump subunit AcrA (membrane-fusion protein)
VVAPLENVAISTTLAEPTNIVTVQEGDVVRKGQLLVQLDTADLQASLASYLAQANGYKATTAHNEYAGNLSIAQGNSSLDAALATQRQAQANLKRDETDLHRYQDLLARGFISEQAVNNQQTTVNNDAQALRSADAAVASAKANVQANGPSLDAPGLASTTIQTSRATELVALASAQQQRVQIAKARIVSPIDGVVVNRNINPGEYPGTRQILTLQQVNSIYAVLRGSGAQIATIRTGATARIVSTDANVKGRRGRVAGILNQIVPGSTDFQVKVLVENADGKFRPGMAVTGYVNTPPVSGVRVPTTSFTNDNHDKLMIVQDGAVKVVEVVEVANDGKRSVVTGLDAGASVVTNGQLNIGDGQKVTTR